MLPVLVAALLAGCTSGESPDSSPDPSSALAALVVALQQEKLDDAAALTSDPGVAGQLLDTVIQDLAPEKLLLTPGAWDRTSDTTATVPVRFSWRLPEVGEWTYQASWNWTRRGTGDRARWTVDWSPTVVHPELGARQTLVVRSVDAEPGTLVDRTDRQLVTPVRVFAVQASPVKITDPEATAATLVKVLKKYDAALDTATVVTGIADADRSIGYTVINLREKEFEAVQQKLAKIPGLTFPDQVRNLGPSKDFARTLLTQVEPVAARLAQGKPGWDIVSVDATGAEVATLASRAPDAGAKTIVTLDITAQTAAEKALATVPEAAVLVAIQPSTGEIVAVAQNAAANVEGPIALTGQYPPGSIFKIVTASAAIGRKLITPATVVPCPGELTIDYRPIRNEGFELGDVPARLAFAKSCNTTFAQLATQLPADALTTTAEQYGIGVDFAIPGITTFTGSVPVAPDTVQRAEDGFGQGQVLVTPFSAALMAATAARGKMPTPVLIRGQKTTADRPVAAPSAIGTRGVSTLMAAVVEEGTAVLLQDVGTAKHPVHAKTGTAEYTDQVGDLKAHAWTVGYRGDLAFSVLIVGGDTSKRTNEIARQFLAAVKTVS